MPATLTRSTHPASQPVAAPSPAEIRNRCREIQATWSQETRRKRAAFKVESWMLKAVEVMLPESQSEKAYHGEDFCGRVA